MIRGETIILINRKEVGRDYFGAPLFAEEEISVDNVLLGSPTFEQSVAELQFSGKRIAYVLGIPKGDEHMWEDTDVIIRGRRYRTYGPALTQTEENVPGPWNTQIKVERYE